jgi:hypothetical protein
MLADDRSTALVTNFAGQWLHLRNLASATPDKNEFPEFDDNMRQAFQRETELFVESQVRDDRAAPELLTANYTFLNEQLARHYRSPTSMESLPARDAHGQSTVRPARAGQHSHGDVIRQPHVTHAAWQVRARHLPRRSAAGAAARRALIDRIRRGRTRAVGARTA